VKIRPAGAALFRAERQDRRDVVVAYLNFAHAPNMTHFAKVVYIYASCAIFSLKSLSLLHYYPVGLSNENI